MRIDRSDNAGVLHHHVCQATGRHDTSVDAHLAAHARDQRLRLSDETKDDAGLQGLYRIAADGVCRCVERNLRQLCGPADKRVNRDVDARRDRDTALADLAAMVATDLPTGGLLARSRRSN